MLGFDDYPDIADRLRRDRRGGSVRPRTPRGPPHAAADHARSSGARPGSRPPATAAPRSRLRLPIGPGPRTLRRRLDGGPVASLKLASGLRPALRFLRHPPLPRRVRLPAAGGHPGRGARAGREGVRELVLVSENSTSYGKDLGDMRLLEQLLPAARRGRRASLRVRVAYLQPAELRPGLVETLADARPGSRPIFDLSFQHASGAVLRRMRRFGDGERFLDLLAEIRELGARRPVPGATSSSVSPARPRGDVAELERFLNAARLDAVGVFGYSRRGRHRGRRLAWQVGRGDHRPAGGEHGRPRGAADRAACRGADRQLVEVLVEEIEPDGGEAEGRAAHQAPEIDGSCTVRWGAVPGSPARVRRSGARGGGREQRCGSGDRAR